MKYYSDHLLTKMLILAFVFIACLTAANGFHVTKISSEVTVFDTKLERNQHLHIEVKKINKAAVEHVILKNCSGVIDDTTFRHFPKLSKITVWRSNIEEILAVLPITRLVVMGSHFPNLNSDLQQKLPKLQGLMLLGNKNFEVDSSVLKNFKHLKALHISEARFTSDCITKDWFKGMYQIEELGLSDNRIDCVTEDAFNHLPNLRKLDLTYNRIPNIERKLFKKLTKLEKLGLYENQIDRLDLGVLSNQRNHLEELGLSWSVIKNSLISADDLMTVLPKIKLISFGHAEMPNDFKAGEFCQILRQRGVVCEIDSVFGASRILGYSMFSTGNSN